MVVCLLSREFYLVQILAKLHFFTFGWSWTGADHLLLAVDHRNTTIFHVMQGYVLALASSQDAASQYLAHYVSRTLPSSKQTAAGKEGQTFNGGPFTPMVRSAVAKGKQMVLDVTAKQFPTKPREAIKVWALLSRSFALNSIYLQLRLGMMREKSCMLWLCYGV